MKYILVVLIFLSQVSLAYEYSNKDKSNLVQGCLKTGASQEFCRCQLHAMESTLSRSQLPAFQKSLISIYRGGSTRNLPDLHFKAMQKMSECVGL